jgi:hypothetical protein
MSNPAPYGPPDYEALYRQTVIDRLEKLDEQFRELSDLLSQRYIATTKEISDLRVNLGVVEAVLRIKAGIWGASSGLAAGLMMVLIFLLTKIIK